MLIASRPVDFRKGADSLAALARETLAQDPFSGAVLVFRGRRADRVKILVWGRQRPGTGLEAARTGRLQMATDQRRGDATVAGAARRAR